MMKNESYDTITIMKAIGISLMVIGHTECPKVLLCLIYAFHMPLFFFASGYCLKQKYIGDVGVFVKQKIKNLYVPFVKYSLLFLLLHNVFYYLGFYGQVGGGNLLTPIDIGKRALRIMFTMSGEDTMLGGFWFVRALFIGSIISLITISLSRRTGLVWGWMVLLGAVLFSKFTGLNISMINFQWCLIGAMFHYSGYWFSLRQQASSFDVLKKWEVVLGCILLLVLIISVILLPMDIFAANFKETFSCIIMAYAGVMLCYILSTRIALMCSNKPAIMHLFKFVGSNTIYILAWHFLVFKGVSWLIITIYSLPMNNIGYFPYIPHMGIWWVVYSLMGISMPLLMIYYFWKLNLKLY